MSHVLTVPTHFEDLSQLSEGFVDRVEHDTLILYGPVPYEEGEDIDFAVLLADGTPAIEGKGRVRAAVDGGEERVPETRYDVVVEALRLEGRYEAVFESLVLARQSVSEPPATPDEDGDSASSTDSASESPTDTASENGTSGLDEGAFLADQMESELNGDPNDTGAHAVPLSETRADDWKQPAGDDDIDDELGETKSGIPTPSAAPPPMDLPEPPHLRVERGPEGLTRPSFADGDQVDAETLAEYEDSWSDPPPGDASADDLANPTPEAPALFNYENDLPIPERPPLPGAEPASPVEPVEGDADHEPSDYDEVAHDS